MKRFAWIAFLLLGAGVSGGNPLGGTHAHATSQKVQRKACRLARQLDALHLARRRDRVEQLEIRETLSLEEVRLRKIRDSSPAVLFDSKVEEGSVKGFRFKIRRQQGRHWNSNFGAATSNPHFDPRAFVSAAGPEAGKHFGYQVLSDDVMLVPSAERFNHAVRAINRATDPKREHLRILLKLEPVQGKLGLREFFEGFAERGSIPLGSEWELFVHDINVHTLAVLLPNDFIRHAQAQTRFMLEWVDFVKKSNLPDAVKESVERQYFNFHASALDDGGGVFGIKAGEGDLGSAYFFAKSVLVMEGISPKQALETTLERFQGDAEALELRELFEKFAASRASKPEFSQAMEKMPEEAKFISQVNARRRHFEAVARSQP